MMPPSPIVESALTQSHYLSKPSHSAESCSDREILSHNSSLEESNLGDEAGSFGSCTRSNNDYSSRFQLQQDVQRLQQQLQEEMELHAILEKAIQKNALKFSSPSRLPHQAQELLSNISLLEITVSKLEQEMVSLHFQLSQERNERRLAEYHLRHSASQSISLHSSDIMDTSSSPSLKKVSVSEVGDSSEDNCQEMRDQSLESTDKCTELVIENAVDSIALGHDKKMTMKMDSNSFQPLEFSKLSKGMPSNGLWNYPNQLSEEMVRCMKNIFMSLADSTIPSKTSASESHCSPLSPHGTSPRGHLSSSSWWSSSERSMISSWLQSPQIDIQSNSEVVASDNACDPYRVRRKLSWANIGNYGLATEVSWMSVGKKQLEYASGALRRFRTLVEQLAKVNPIRLSCDEKLAFWINLYNALIMHAYLAYGVPRSDLKLFSLLQKAAYTVGGHSFSAAAIEYVILKMKPPLHRPQIALLLALHKLKVSEEQRESAVDIYEPLVAFALSCGMYSSPAVRIYTAQNVREELQEAQRDFIRASVGVSSKGRLLVPKMLHCFAKAFVDDANLAVWILHYLPPHQATFVEQCISQRRQSLLGSRNCGILPFDSRFRYLFLPDKIPLC
ncbi:hypothetical protein I3760_01G205900 [Carya illinoinensis]|nr:hypothetical protein I3760_01G205900 [Carya illinoinensis]KAG2728456.1 hypothetical protein I3760_01G205900 [Carya illinoinensis]KAG2728457.1 hypothetical protein I3760_01G205900 [Carya illinoinensis]KAG2728458.1 hypothetical protein I3760_01G205900 [Carya illinoinensis]KAG2728459.1 hypothetical protein I3760_01G205900 [Carya illinoinensis]